MSRSIVFMTTLLCMCLNIGCTSTPPPATGFLSDYSKLAKESDGAMRYTSPKMASYNAFIIDPAQVGGEKKLNEKERADVAHYLSEALSKELIKRGYRVVAEPGPGVARIRVAITDIQESKWYLNLHPASKLTGAGTGGASMEGEVLDSVTGEQLGAAIQAGKGSQFELDHFSKLDDVKDAINKWAEMFGKRLDEMRKPA